MESFAFLAGTMFGFLMLATMTAIALHIGDPSMIKVALIATIFGYVTQVFEFYRIYDPRVQLFGYVCWGASVVTGGWLVVMILQWQP